MVDSIILLVDASEGPLPQTRFVLTKAIEQGLKITVVINKIDRPDRRIDEVVTEVEDLLLTLATELDIEDFDLDIPIFYASAKEGYAMSSLDNEPKDLTPLLDHMVSDYCPTPKINQGEGFQLLVTNLSYSNYLGQQLIGRISRGKVTRNQSYIHCDAKELNKKFKVTNIQIFDALTTKEVEEASAGEIILLSGINNGEIGDSIVSSENIDPVKGFKLIRRL